MRPADNYRELGGGPDAPALMDRRGEPPLSDRERVLAYLRSAGTVLAVAPGITRDALSPSRPIIGAPSIHFDGVWSWRGELEYYVEHYNVLLDEEFLAHVRARSELLEIVAVPPCEPALAKRQFAVWRDANAALFERLTPGDVRLDELRTADGKVRHRYRVTLLRVVPSESGS